MACVYIRMMACLSVCEDHGMCVRADNGVCVCVYEDNGVRAHADKWRVCVRIMACVNT